jgi:hypothetical protein
LKLRATSYVLAGLLLLGVIGAVNAADAALVRVDRVIVRADGGFKPQTLPRTRYAPISFQGRADLESTDGGPVPQLKIFRLEFDRDGLLTTRGLPACAPSRIQNATPKGARRICAKSLVGTGEVAAAISEPDLGPIRLRSPLSLFNGPRVGGHPTVVAHAHSSYPKPEKYVVVIPIERRDGPYSYRATIEVPTIADGNGSLTHVDARIGRRYRSGGKRRSYVSARCRDGIMETRGRLEFHDGTVIEGSVVKPCNWLRSVRKGRGR